ncbi:MAG TPA: hypothetical protein VHJ77_00135 [Vicinamibacterales bacterium]|jgi:hypothetical protein|nr:hypothetical protein [Vicinamibacterales bacterium]
MAVGVRSCTVSFRGPSGIIHSVEIQAESLYEAAAVGVALLKKDGWIEGLGPATKLEIAVREPATTHVLSIQQLQRWLDGVTKTPLDALRKAKLRQLLGARPDPPRTAR